MNKTARFSLVTIGIAVGTLCTGAWRAEAEYIQGTSNNTLLWLSERLRRSCQGGPPIGDRFDA